MLSEKSAVVNDTNEKVIVKSDKNGMFVGIKVVSKGPGTK
jgi:hypothetical protein